VKKELTLHLVPLIIVFFITSVFWLFSKVNFTQYISLFIGLGLGSFFLDIDHFIYWFYTHTNLQESRIAKAAFKRNDYKSLLGLLAATHKSHVDLIFHHYFFQILLLTISLYVFSSTSTIFGKAFLLALNIHLLVDEFTDFKENPKHLQNWLFARSPKQIPQSHLQQYLFFFTSITLVFFFLLIKSRA
jgi:hypothetical protein